MIRNSWFYYNFASRRMHWGQPRNDHGEIISIGPSGRQNQHLIDSIKEGLWKGQMPIVDPLMTYNTWPAPGAPSGTINSLRGILDIDEERDGAMGLSEFNEAWKNSLVAAEAFAVHSDGTAIVNALSEDPTRSQCASVSAYTKKTVDGPSSVRNNHNRDASYFMPKTVKFADFADDGMDIDFEPGEHCKSKKATEAMSRKVRLLDELSADSGEIIRLLL
jgi:hypothetical protein